LCLGLDYFPVNEELSNLLNKVNIGFFVIFFIEMIIKVVGLGPNSYIKDHYNIFDSLIVALSIIDVFLSATVPENVKMGHGAISVFRAFRLLRVFKLAKSWK
jgi:voltage-gated sodium channel type V alpha